MFGRKKLKSWGKLESLYRGFKKTQMRDLFAADENRADKYTLKLENLLLDYSKNRVDDKVMAALFDLARERDVTGRIKAMFSIRTIRLFMWMDATLCRKFVRFWGGLKTFQRRCDWELLPVIPEKN